MPIRIRASKPLRYTGPLPTLKVRISGRKACAVVPQVAFTEVRGVHVYSYADRVVVSDGIYTTERYAQRLQAAGGTWDGSVWTLPAGTDVRAAIPPQRCSWICCSEAQILNRQTKHYSCSKHTMYWEEGTGTDGQPIKILYSCTTLGGSPYTGT